MLKREEGTRTSLGVKCKSCIHHTRLAHPEDKKPCESLGISGNATACIHFNPDMIRVTSIRPELIKMLGEFTSNSTAEQAQILAFAVRSSEYMKRHGLGLGQKVYFHLAGDYLQNYFHGLVVNVSKDGEFVYVSSSLKQKEGQTLLTLMRASVLNEKQWEIKRKKLIASDAVFEPRGRRGRKTMFEELAMTKKDLIAYRETLASHPEDFKPTSIDDVNPTWLDSRRPAQMSEARKTEVKKQVAKSKKVEAAVRKKGNTLYVNRSA